MRIYDQPAVYNNVGAGIVGRAPPAMFDTQSDVGSACTHNQLDESNVWQSSYALLFLQCLVVVVAGLYELSQYAFLADRNGGEGLTWAKLHDPECGMITVWAILAAEWFVFLTNAWYLDQVCIHARKEKNTLLGMIEKSSWLLQAFLWVCI